MAQELFDEIMPFINACDNEIAHGIYSAEKANIARKYHSKLSALRKKATVGDIIIEALVKKLELIAKQIDAYTYRQNSKEAVLNLVPLSVTDYITNLIREKRLTDPLLIARFAYIELSKVLYYNVSYVKQTDPEAKRIICDAKIDVKKEKIFSYIVCTQFYELYSYILAQFGINVVRKNIPGQDHVWGEIELNNQSVIITDATDYINNSIDLSNAKSNSPTVGFAVLPKKYSGIRLYDVFNGLYDQDTKEEVKNCYEFNRELDTTLGYIGKNGYKVEQIIRENDLFSYQNKHLTGATEVKDFTNLTLEFFKTLKVPNNMDGYEVFAYYQRFLNNLPNVIGANISHKTLYVDSFSYKQNTMKKTLHAPSDYLDYLQDLVCNRYYRYLTEEENNAILEQIKNGSTDSKTISSRILEYELKLAELNRKLNLFYAINKLQFYVPMSGDFLQLQLYEPMMGKKTFKTEEEFDSFRKTIILK